MSRHPDPDPDSHTTYAGSPPDAALVALAIAGSSDAYSILARRYYGQVYAIAFSHLRAREAAEELTQDVFIRGYLHLAKLSDYRRFPQWVCRIARNLALNWIRDQRRSSEVLRMIRLDGLPQEPSDNSPSPRDVAASAQLERWLEDAIATLPAELREAVLLHYFENVPKAQIAELQGVNPSTLGRRIDKAIEQLQRKLAGEALTQLKSHWKPQRATQAMALLVTGVAALPAATHAAVLAATADTLQLGALTSSGATALSAGSSTLKTGAGVMITKTGIAVTAAALVAVGVVAFPSFKHRAENGIKASSELEASENPRRSLNPGSFRDARGAQSAKRSVAAKSAGTTTASARGSSVTLGTAPVEEAALDSGTTAVDPSAITTATAVVTVKDEQGSPVAGANVSVNGARVANDSRIWQWSASGQTDDHGQVSLTVLQTVANMDVSELQLQANHSSYQPLYEEHLSFSLAPALVMKRDLEDKHIVRVHVQDEAGQPVPGVTVQGRGMRESSTPSTFWFWTGAPYKGTTDASGIASVPYSARIVSGKVEVTSVVLGLYHPAFTNQSEELAVDPPDQQVTLHRGAELVVSGYIGKPSELVTGLQVKIDGQAGTEVPWDEAKDKTTWEQLDSTHLYNRKVKRGTRAIYLWAEVKGSTYYSDITPVKVNPGERKELNLELKPAIPLRGMLSDNVPRPIVNGQVKWEMPNVNVKDIVPEWGDEPRPLTLSHGGVADIKADGSFDLGMQPAGKLEIAAICNGWRNKDGSSLSPSMKDISVLPQVFDITTDAHDVTLEMEQTSGFRATVLKPNGEPLEGVDVGFSPNVFFLNYSTLFIREHGFNAKTDAAGNVYIADLPHGKQYVSVYPPGDQWRLPDELQKDHGRIVIEQGKVTQMVIKLAENRDSAVKK